MSKRYDPQQPNYRLDDILAEFGSQPTPSTPDSEQSDAPLPQMEPTSRSQSPQVPSSQPSMDGPEQASAVPDPPQSASSSPASTPEPQVQSPPEQAPDPEDPPQPTKVLPFPDQLPSSASDGSARRSGPETARFSKHQTKPHSRLKPGGDRAPMPVIRPANLLRNVAARLSTLQRRADHYADHMYDQAEPDQETVKAETYLPGVDQEAPAKPAPRRVAKPPKPARVKPSQPPPPDTPPIELAARYQKGLKARRKRVTAGWFVSFLAVGISIPLPISLPTALAGVSVPQLKAWTLSALLVIVGILCMEILVLGVVRLVKLRPRAESLVALAWLFSLLDALTFSLWPQRGDALPCCAVTALGLTMAMWGRCLRQQGDRLSAKAASQTRAPYVVSLDEDKWNHRPAYCKWAGTARGFGSQLQMEDGAQKAWSVAAAVLLPLCLGCALLSSVAQQAPERFLWAASAAFTAAASYSALLAFALPYQKLAARLYKAGAAMAGWAGVSRCCHAGIVITDGDLFPPGSVQVSHFELYGNLPKEKVVSYAATLLKIANCDLTQPFYKLLQSTGSLYREATGVRFHEGGITGIIHNHDIIVGTSDFMHLVDIPLPRSLKVKHAIFCAVDGQLAAMFPISYSLPSAVRPSLSTLIGLNVTPILATRDPNLIPSLLEQKFKLPVDKMEFPSTDRRRELSEAMQEHSTQPVALLSREGVGVFCDTVLGCRRLRWATRLSLGFSLGGAALGVLLTFFLTYSGSYAALSPVNFLVFMFAWVVPELLIAGWVNQY